jgi:PAS domain S-box-containing protein
MFNDISDSNVLETLLRSMNEMVFILDADFNINAVNLSAKKILGYNENEIRGKTISFLFAEAKTFDTFLDKSEQKKSIGNFESVFVTKIGDPVKVLLYAEKITDSTGAVSANIVTALNVTLYKSLEGALRTGYDELSALNNILINSRNELEQSNAKLIELDKLKNNFISMISHELRTPLTAIKGFLSLLAREAAGPITPMQKDFIDTIKNNSERLLRLINDLLDMSKIESGTFSINCSNDDLCNIIDASINDISAIAQSKNIKLIKNYKSGKMPAYIDSYRISQVAINLLNNALKFSPGNSSIRINIIAEDLSRIQFPAYVDKNNLKACQYYRVSLKDEGPGIPAEFIEKIFDAFFQLVQSSTSKPHGIGLGLPITREIILKHGGRIWAVSEGAGKGSEFIFIIPTERNER